MGLLGHGGMGTPDRQPVLGGGSVGGGNVSGVAPRCTGGSLHGNTRVHEHVPVLDVDARSTQQPGPQLLLTDADLPQAVGGVGEVRSITEEFTGLPTQPVGVVGDEPSVVHTPIGEQCDDHPPHGGVQSGHVHRVIGVGVDQPVDGGGRTQLLGQFLQMCGDGRALGRVEPAQQTLLHPALCGADFGDVHRDLLGEYSDTDRVGGEQAFGGHRAFEFGPGAKHLLDLVHEGVFTRYQGRFLRLGRSGLGWTEAGASQCTAGAEQGAAELRTQIPGFGVPVGRPAVRGGLGEHRRGADHTVGCGGTLFLVTLGTQRAQGTDRTGGGALWGCLLVLGVVPGVIGMTGSGGDVEVVQRFAHVVGGRFGEPIGDGAYGFEHQRGGGGGTIGQVTAEPQGTPGHGTDDVENTASGQRPGTDLLRARGDEAVPVTGGGHDRSAHRFGEVGAVHGLGAKGRQEFEEGNMSPVLYSQAGDALGEPGRTCDVQGARDR